MQLRQLAAPILLLGRRSLHARNNRERGWRWIGGRSSRCPVRKRSRATVRAAHPHFHRRARARSPPGIGARNDDVPYTVTPATTTIYTLS